MPAGPTTLEELRAFQVDFRPGIEAHSPLWAQRSFSNLQHGIEAVTDYSGMECPRECCRQIGVAWPDLMERVKLELPPGQDVFVWSRSSDSDKLCRQVLSSYSEQFDSGRSCVFGDIRERLPRAINDNLDVIARLRDPSEKQHMSKRTRQEQAMRLQAVQEFLMDRRDEAFPVHAKSACMVHGRMCSTRYKARSKQLDMHPARLCLNFAGVVCRGWSGLGHQLIFADDSEVPHSVWSAERLRFAESAAEDGFMFECTSAYPVMEKLRAPMQRTHHVVFVKTGPHLLGHPVSRTRVHACGLSLDRMVWLGPSTDEAISAEFHKVFGRSSELDGDIYLQAPAEDVLAEHRVRMQRGASMTRATTPWIWRRCWTACRLAGACGSTSI